MIHDRAMNDRRPPETISYPHPASRPTRQVGERTAPHVIVLFGAAGDLSRRKLLPGLVHIATSALAPPMRIVGTSLEDFDDAGFRAFAEAAVAAFGGHHRISPEQWAAVASSLSYVPMENVTVSTYAKSNIGVLLLSSYGCL